LIAGLASGSASRTLTAPAERIKTELQLLTGREKQHVVAISRRVVSESGFKGFFQGNLANCIKVAPQSAGFFVLTDYFRFALPRHGALSSGEVHSFVTGILAGLTSQFVVYPLETVKTHLTVAPKGRFAGIWDCTAQVVRHGGIRALYRGTLPTLFGCIPYAGTQRLVYDSMQSFQMRHHGQDRASTASSFLSGLVSTSLGMIVSYPFVLVRTRMQVQGTTSDGAAKYTGMLDCFQKTIRSEGLVGLTRGMLPNLMKVAPAAAMNFALYESTKEMLQDSWQLGFRS
jgi:solute carrier family 25 phosphate transporter 23/24/25/41